MIRSKLSKYGPPLALVLFAGSLALPGYFALREGGPPSTWVPHVTFGVSLVLTFGIFKIAADLDGESGPSMAGVGVFLLVGVLWLGVGLVFISFGWITSIVWAYTAVGVLFALAGIYAVVHTVRSKSARA